MLELRDLEATLATLAARPAQRAAQRAKRGLAALEAQQLDHDRAVGKLTAAFALLEASLALIAEDGSDKIAEDGSDNQDDDDADRGAVRVASECFPP